MRFARWLAVVAVALPIAAVVFVGVRLDTSKATIAPSPTALAKVTLPFGGGRIARVIVSRALDDGGVPVTVSRGVITPKVLVPVGEKLSVSVVVKRPGWASWLTGSAQHLELSITAPATRIRQHYVTLHAGELLRVRFRTPVRVFESGSSVRALHRTVVADPQTDFTIATSSAAGTAIVAAAPRTWEQPRPTFVSWFPAGSGAQVVATPSPNTAITPHTAITLTFSKPVSKVLGTAMPPVTPATSGTWVSLNSHTIRFVPTGYGYGLGAHVVVVLPSQAHLLGGAAVGSDPQGRWIVPNGSTTRLQQLLAGLGYLPVSFQQTGTPVADTTSAQLDAAAIPPQGSFTWRYPNTPAALRAEWEPGTYGELTKGAVMAFESDQGMTPDGAAGHDVWKALIAATIAHHVSTFGYTYVSVSEGSPESEFVWHNGRIVVHGVVNTGVPAAPTATGTFAVFEHLTVTTMTGINPDGSHYSDPGIPWVSYFNGGDALHGFIRASYGFPQSDGCVEMPYSEAEAVWPFTPVGTIVDVHA